MSNNPPELSDFEPFRSGPLPQGDQACRWPPSVDRLDAVGAQLPLSVLTTALALTLWVAFGSLVLAIAEGLGDERARRLLVGLMLVVGTGLALLFRRRVCWVLLSTPWLIVGVAVAQLAVVGADSLVGGPYVAFTMTSIGLAVVVAPTSIVWLCVAVLEFGYIAGVLAVHTPAQLVRSGQLAGVVGQVLAYPFAALALLGLAVLFRRFMSNAPVILYGIRGGVPALTPALSHAIAQSGDTRRALPPGRWHRPRLTPTEVQIVEELARGKRAKQIAHERGVSVAAIRTHIANAKRKTGTRTLPQLAALARHPDWPEGAVQHA